jgi:ribosome-associated translation inhibitor RaiA
MPTIQIRGLERKAALRAIVRERFDAALRGLTVTPVSGAAVFVDDNGPRGGGIRCALTLRLPYRRSLRAERTAQTPRRALEAAFTALERQLAEARRQQRERRRRPKKYYVAKRLLA